MRTVFLYIFESTLLLAFFYLLYRMLLSRETYFALNRFVLIAIPLLAIILPLLRFDVVEISSTAIDKPLTGLSTLSRSYYDTMVAWQFAQGEVKAVEHIDTNGLNLFLVFASVVYAGGVLFCLSRTIRSIQWIRKTLVSNPVTVVDGIRIVRLSEPLAPFSFLNNVFVPGPLMETEDFHQILRHERVHVEEKHTIDLLYMQVFAAVFWFNPIIWQLLKSLKTTHEYIADRKIIQAGYSVVEYQIILLKQLISNNSQELVHNFNLSFMKKRITMMTTKRSGWAGGARVSIAIFTMVCASITLIQCNSKIDEDSLVTPALSGEAGGVRLPTLPASGFRFGDDLDAALSLTIAHNTLYIGDKAARVEDIQAIESELFGRKLPMIMKVDENQEMGFVRKVHTALRNADRRKLLYLGMTTSGEPVEVLLILPPARESLPNFFEIPEERLLKIYAGDDNSMDNQRKVKDFVMSFVKNGDGELPVVSVKFNDSDNFGSYLKSFFYTKEGYIDIYQERARKLFGKDFYATTKEEYDAAREKIPMNISIAEE